MTRFVGGKFGGCLVVQRVGACAGGDGDSDLGGVLLIEVAGRDRPGFLLVLGVGRAAGEGAAEAGFSEANSLGALV